MRSPWQGGPAKAVLLTACTAVTIAGCASTRTGTGTGITPVTTAKAATSAMPHGRAVTDAAAILRAFVRPPGASRLRTPPPILSTPSSTIVATSLVDDVSFWRTPGQPQAVLAWEQRHLPGRFRPGDSDFGPPTWDRTFSLVQVPGVLNSRDLVVEVTRAGHGQTAIRVDAQVSWQPPRPASERVPSAARVVTVASPGGTGPRHGHRPRPVTITGRAVVRRLAALVDSLALSTIGPGASCPAAFGDLIRLTFRARADGPPLAVAQGPAACGTVQFSIGGRQQPALQLTDTFIPQVLKLAGLRWKIP